MVPDKTNPIWRKIVSHSDDYIFTTLATKLMMMRVKMIVENENTNKEENIQQGIDIAYEYFKKNQSILIEDVDYLFKDKDGV